MPANYVLLERIELNASAASITFANIPQTGYTDLKAVFSVREATGTSYTMGIRFNGTTTNYSRIDLRGNGAAASSGSASSFEPIVNSSGATASTFGNGEIYIPNYTSATNKSVSIDSTSENNATTSFLRMTAGLWSNVAAITQIDFVPDTGSFAANSTFSLYGLAATGTTPVIAPKASGGNRIDYDGTYWIHTFNTSGTFTPATGLTCDYLVVAGGGGGGSGVSGQNMGGGGGAGGLRSTVTATGGGGSLESALSVAKDTAYTVTVGAGGAGGVTNLRGTNGSNSVFSSITSTGGGGGGGNSTDRNGNTGGSGGGGLGTGGTVGTGGAGTTNQGYAGGTGTNVSGPTFAFGAGGGGGANAVGANGSDAQGGNGGAGVATSISGSSVTRAGGGGGGANTASGGTGGSGGGGAGAVGAATSGTVNTGGGGGGSGNGNQAGTGGSGIVIIRYLA